MSLRNYIRRTAAPTSQIDACRVTGGDTIRCGGERVRLLGIDAPELPAHFRVDRICALGDPYASSASLAEAMASAMKIERVGRSLRANAGDGHWPARRPVVLAACAPAGDLQIYKPDWDNDGRVAILCPDAIP